MRPWQVGVTRLAGRRRPVQLMPLRLKRGVTQQEVEDLKS